MHLSFKVYVIAVIQLLLSCNTNSNQGLNDEIYPPKQLDFSSASTANLSNNVQGYDITGTIKGRHRIIIDTAKKEIELILKFPNGTSDNKFFWTSKQYKTYSDRDWKKGLLFIGVDDAQDYAEVEYFYTANNTVSTIVLRSPKTNSIIILDNISEKK